MTNNINKLTKAQLINLLKETEDRLQTKTRYYATLDEQLLKTQEELKSLQTRHLALQRHAAKQHTQLQQLQQTYTLIINNAYQKDFLSKEACHAWMKEYLHSYKLINTITTPACKVAFILAVSKAKAASK